jgi:hypothetical protein
MDKDSLKMHLKQLTDFFFIGDGIMHLIAKSSENKPDQWFFKKGFVYICRFSGNIKTGS